MLWRTEGDPTRQFVDLARDATVADIARAVGAGMTHLEHIKRYTTIGTAHDQGKTSGMLAAGITAELLGRPARRPRDHDVPPAVHPGRVRGARRPRARRAVRPGAHHRDPRPARGGGRGVRGRRAVAPTPPLPASRRGHDRRGAARVRGGAERGRDPRRLHPRHDRRAGPGRRGAARPPLHEPDEHAEASAACATASCAATTAWSSTTAPCSGWHRTASWSRRPPATPPPSSTAWRSGSRPSGPTCGSDSPR